MSARQAICPSCKATLTFQNAASLYVVCEFCSFASYRTDVRLELIGKVAEVAPIDSPIELRATGTLDGQEFTVVGQLQLDHGAGPWNEWCVVLADGSWAWIAEAQGQILATRAIELVPVPASVPAHGDARPGTQVPLAGHGTFVVAERGSGRVVAARGELPVRSKPGDVVRYADLSGPGGGFGTLDYGAGDACEAIYVGRRVELSDLKLDTTGAAARPARVVKAGRIACPKCAGAIELRDPEGARRIGCPYCSAILDATSPAYDVLGASDLIQRSPSIPIGARGSLRGDALEVVAFLVRSVTSEGVRYPWDEYLLRRADGAYRWLVCSDGHWSFVEPLNLADVKRSRSRVSHGGSSFRHFSSGRAQVDHVVGEVYWEVHVGEAVRVEDFVAPPRMISFEESEGEKLVSLGTYVTPAEVTLAFDLQRPLSSSRGVGAQQPNPYRGAARGFWRVFLVSALALVVLAVTFAAAHDDRVAFERTFPLPGAGDPVLLSDEFELQAWRGNVQLEIRAPGLPQGRFTCEGALVESGTETSRPFELSAYGTSEPDIASTAGIGQFDWSSVPRGKYRLRLAPHATGSSGHATAAQPSPSGAGGTSAGEFLVRVRSQVPHTGWIWILLLMLVVPPVFASIAIAVFEGARWQKSDHA